MSGIEKRNNVLCNAKLRANFSYFLKITESADLQREDQS
jgi:hypothetical protein